jgi:NadR type nicotinamide-nucleotide adenylyltransferase
MEKPFRIAIIGPESTGKTTLAKALSQLPGAVWVPEYARLFLERHGKNYDAVDIAWIATAQQAYEIQLARRAPKLLICDTDWLVCKIWSAFVFGFSSPKLKGLEEQCRYDFTLLMDVDLPWEPDPLREHPFRRAEILEIYKVELEKIQRPYSLISGTGGERISNALDILRPWLDKINQ